MILIFGGTTEGRIAANVCDEGEKTFYYATKGINQHVTMSNGKTLQGTMQENDIQQFCTEKNIKLIIDAAHPFAINLHNNIALVSKKMEIPVIRIERIYTKFHNKLVHYFNNYNEAVVFLLEHNYKTLLGLSGVNTISLFKEYWKDHNTLFRILDRKESIAKAKEIDFPQDKLLYYNKDEDEFELFKKINPSVIVTKDSGKSGGVVEKIDAAIKLSIPILVIKRPELSKSFITVTGKYGLRRKIEKLLPSFYKLRSGYTTGSCATAASKAALEYLITKKEAKDIDITLPDGEVINIPVFKTIENSNSISCSVIKDGGDDPDATNGKEIISTISLNKSHNKIVFLAGKGVGTITLPGFGFDKGEPAINEIPRKMICYAIDEIMHKYNKPFPNIGIDVTISVPGGLEIAKKTFNPKLGIVGGISILGTSGIVRPYSAEAFIASIIKEMQIARASGYKQIILNSGTKSENFAHKIYPSLPRICFIHYGNFIGDSIVGAKDLGFEMVTLIILIGKAIKLANGNMDTHSKKVQMNKEFIIETLKECNCDDSQISKIKDITMARQLWDIIEEPIFFQKITDLCHFHCKKLFQKKKLNVYLINSDGSKYYKKIQG